MLQIPPPSEGNHEANSSDPHDPFTLWRVAMPIVRLMKEGQLTWAQMEECAWALQEALRQHRSLMAEHQYHQQAECGKQMAPASDA